MISTKNIIRSIKDVDSGWLFQHLLTGIDKLEGQEICIKSPLNPSERTPSFTVFCDKKGQYFWKCFSTGLGGNVLQLAQALHPEILKQDLYKKLCVEYANYCLTGKHETQPYKQFHKYKVHDFSLRTWNTSDKSYWGQFHIKSETLERYNIAALQHYTLKKELPDGTHKTLQIEQSHIYGYFDKTGSPFKVYQPHSKTCKFFKIRAYVQGDDQLLGKENLLITKSLKDICGFTTLGFENWEAISPDSENTLLSEKYVEEKRKKYKQIVTLFDNDTAGSIARESYKEKFKLPTIIFDRGHKDLTDHMKALGLEKVRTEFIKLLK